MAIKGKLKQKTGSNTSEILHPETDASITQYSNTIGETSVTNVKDALDEIITAGVGVTGVKGNAETDYRVGQVNLTPANIGAVVANSAITAKTGAVKINYDAKGLVTGSSALADTDIPNLTLAKITDAGTAAAKGVATTISSSSTDSDLATAKAVYTAIENLPDPMVFKGSLGTNGTATSLPSAASGNKGHTYKVITAGTYASQSAKVGDVFISNGTAWILIPSGDDVEDTWRAIKVNGTQLLGSGISTGAVNLKNGGNITVSGSGNDVTFGVASGYSIPSTDNQTAWTNKQDALDAQTAYSAKGTTTKVPQITTNALGQVTLIEEKSIAFPNITVASSGSGNAITAIEVDSSNKHKINITKGSTFLTSHQSLAAYPKKAVAETITGGWTFIATDMTAPSAKFTTTVSDVEYSSSFYGAVLQLEGSWGSSYRSRTRYFDTKIEFTALAGSTTAVYKTLTFDNATSGTILTTGDIGSGNGQQLVTQTSLDNYVTRNTSQNITALKSFGPETNGTINTYKETRIIVSNNEASKPNLREVRISPGAVTVVGNSQSSSVALTASGLQTYGDYGDGTGGPIYFGLPQVSANDTLVVASQITDFASKANMTAGTYSAVSVNAQGIVTAGGQVLEVIENGATPTVANGGWFFEKDA